MVGRRGMFERFTGNARAAVVMYADAIARCDVVLAFAGPLGPVHAAVGAVRSLREPVVLGRDQHDLPLLVATLMRLYAPTGSAAPNQVVRASVRPGPPDQAT